MLRRISVLQIIAVVSSLTLAGGYVAFRVIGGGRGITANDETRAAADHERRVLMSGSKSRAPLASASDLEVASEAVSVETPQEEWVSIGDDREVMFSSKSGPVDWQTAPPATQRAVMSGSKSLSYAVDAERDILSRRRGAPASTQPTTQPATQPANRSPNQPPR